MRILTALAVLPLAACMTRVDVGSTGTCSAVGTERFVGAPATADTAAAIRRQTRATLFRWLPPGTMVTMEFNASRVNVDLDEANRVKAVRCG
jgi:hypothetical protein